MKKAQKNDNKLYDFDYETQDKKKRKSKKKKADTKSASKSKDNINSASNETGQEQKRKKYDGEIIIGVTKFPEKKKTENKKNKNKTQGNSNTKKTKEKNIKRRKNTINKEQYNVDKSIKIDGQENKKAIKNEKRKKKIIKILLVTLLISGAIVFALISPIFNIRKIEILGNKQITKEELTSLSKIQLDDNIFKVQNIKVANNIKQNAYISEVEVHRILPSTVQIKVIEREPSYMLEYGNGYVYVSNQGYMLEISSIKKELPVLIGTSTSKEDYKAGNRLNEEDLIKLGMVIKIIDSAKTNGISNLITKIDINNSNNYTLHLESERKVAYLGDCSNIETRMLFLVGILEKEKDHAGEIFINMNLNTDNAYFRESV